MISTMRKSGVTLSLLSLVLFACASGSTPAPTPGGEPTPSEGSGHEVTGSRPQQRPTPARKQRGKHENVPAPSPSPDSTPSLGREAQAFVDAHNQARAAVSPAPSEPLPAMRWSSELEAHAKQVADQCRFEHSKSDYGENLSARTGAADPAEVVADWVAEVEHYHANNNRCDPGEVCGHYTQVVWRKSTELGCASTSCNQGSPFGGGQWTMTVCNYAPAGNYNGQRPY